MLMRPIGRTLAERYDAVLRIGPQSAGADEMVAIAEAHGRAVFHSLAEEVSGPNDDLRLRCVSDPGACLLNYHQATTSPMDR